MLISQPKKSEPSPRPHTTTNSDIFLFTNKSTRLCWASLWENQGLTTSWLNSKILLALGIRQTNPPDTYKYKLLHIFGQKRKRGRPSKAKPFFYHCVLSIFFSERSPFFHCVHSIYESLIYFIRRS